MKAYWHILTDNIMEQYEFTPYLQSQEFATSIMPPDLNVLVQIDVPVFIIVNMHAESFDAFSFFDSLNGMHSPHTISIIAYTDLKHDHEGIHKAKTHGVKYVCTKEQVKDLLAHIQQFDTSNH